MEPSGNYTPEQDAFIFENAHAMSFVEIGAKLNISKNAARGRFLRLQEKATAFIKNPDGYRSNTISDELKNNVVGMFNHGHAPRAIAEASGLTTDEVNVIIKESSLSNLNERMQHLGDTDVIGALQQQLKNKDAEIEDLHKQTTQIRTYVKSLAEQIHCIPLPKPIEMPKIKYEPSTSPLIQVALSSDHHAEETIDLEAMEGFNQYNFQIYQERMWYWCDRVVRLGVLRRQEAPIQELHVDLLGDILTGEIHDELIWTNQMRTPRAITRIGLIVAQCLMRFTACYPKVVVTGITGNHGRATKKPHFKQAVENSFDTSIYEIAMIYCREAIEAGKLVFNVPQSLKTTVKRFDWIFLLEHGTGIKMNFGTPYYGIDREKQREHGKRHRTDKDFDFFELGHFHQQGKMCSTIMNGSVIGASEFSGNALSDNQPPSQAVLFVHEKYGIRSFEEIQLKFADGQGHKFNLSPLGL